LQIIYTAKGSNQSWKWLSLVSVCLFALRDVIRQVQQAFKTPYNGKSHTTPAMLSDIARLREHLENQKIQTFTADRLGNDTAVPVRDLFSTGVSYANTAPAFKNFRDTYCKATYAKATSQPATEEDDALDSIMSDDTDDIEMDNMDNMGLEDLVVDDDDGDNSEELIHVIQGVLSASLDTV
jgi:hypothetical protein